MPYTGAGRNGLGVPLMTKPPTPQSPANPPSRNTIGQVYDQILEDLEEAIDLMFANRMNTPPYQGTSFINGYFNSWSAKALLSRVYLYMGNFDEAYRLSTEVIKDKYS
jgi:hypothetical protein